MNRGGHSQKFGGGGSAFIDHSEMGTTIIRGTSSRPLISFASAQPPAQSPVVTQPIPELKQASSTDSDPEQVHNEDDRVYCICKSAYNGRTMIACDRYDPFLLFHHSACFVLALERPDWCNWFMAIRWFRCDNWFHNDCVGVRANQVDLIDVFVCPSCQALTNTVSTWKQKCARTACNLPCQKLSKYCSEWCGMKSASIRVEMASIPYFQLWETVRGVKKPEGIVIDESPQASTKMGLDTDAILVSLRNRLDQIIEKRFSIDTQIQLVISRLKYLALVIRRWENMCLETSRALQAEDILKEDDASTDAPLPVSSKRVLSALPVCLLVFRY